MLLRQVKEYDLVSILVESGVGFGGRIADRVAEQNSWEEGTVDGFRCRF